MWDILGAQLEAIFIRSGVFPSCEENMSLGAWGLPGASFPKLGSDSFANTLSSWAPRLIYVSKDVFERIRGGLYNFEVAYVPFYQVIRPTGFLTLTLTFLIMSLQHKPTQTVPR